VILFSMRWSEVGTQSSVWQAPQNRSPIAVEQGKGTRVAGPGAKAFAGASAALQAEVTTVSA